MATDKVTSDKERYWWIQGRINDILKVESPIAYPDRVYFVKDVPKTKSSKIMRRVIKAKALGKEAGELSALVNPESVENIPLS